MIYQFHQINEPNNYLEYHHCKLVEVNNKKMQLYYSQEEIVFCNFSLRWKQKPRKTNKSKEGRVVKKFFLDSKPNALYTKREIRVCYYTEVLYHSKMRNPNQLSCAKKDSRYHELTFEYT